jgi:hypothetical protein
VPCAIGCGLHAEYQIAPTVGPRFGTYSCVREVQKPRRNGRLESKDHPVIALGWINLQTISRSERTVVTAVRDGYLTHRLSFESMCTHIGGLGSNIIRFEIWGSRSPLRLTILVLNCRRTLRTPPNSAIYSSYGIECSAKRERSRGVEKATTHRVLVIGLDRDGAEVGSIETQPAGHTCPSPFLNRDKHCVQPMPSDLLGIYVLFLSFRMNLSRGFKTSLRCTYVFIAHRRHESVLAPETSETDYGRYTGAMQRTTRNGV